MVLLVLSVTLTLLLVSGAVREVAVGLSMLKLVNPTGLVVKLPELPRKQYPVVPLPGPLTVTESLTCASGGDNPGPNPKGERFGQPLPRPS